MKVTIGEMVDKLITCSTKLYHLENVKRDSDDKNEIAEATIKTNSLNSQRNSLIAEIDIELNEIAKGNQQKLFGQNKMYGK